MDSPNFGMTSTEVDVMNLVVNGYREIDDIRSKLSAGFTPHDNIEGLARCLSAIESRLLQEKLDRRQAIDRMIEIEEFRKANAYHKKLEDTEPF